MEFTLKKRETISKKESRLPKLTELDDKYITINEFCEKEAILKLTAYRVFTENEIKPDAVLHRTDDKGNIKSGRGFNLYLKDKIYDFFERNVELFT